MLEKRGLIKRVPGHARSIPQRLSARFSESASETKAGKEVTQKESQTVANEGGN